MLEHPSTSVVQNPTLPKVFGDNMIGADNQQGSPLDRPKFFTIWGKVNNRNKESFSE